MHPFSFLMDYFNQYLLKHHHTPIIPEEPKGGTSIIVVVPCFDEPDVINSLESLFLCFRKNVTVEIIVVVNFGDSCSVETKDFNKACLGQIQAWTVSHSTENFTCHTIYAPDLPHKFAGVGLARKIGMDEAVYRFNKLGNENGIICGFDADATVDSNYFEALTEHFRIYPKTPGASIYFEHPYETVSDLRLRSGIIQYETHLRYLVNAIRSTGFPYSFHSVGSSFCVTAKAYVRQGGMNKFKAGEDFYFINKIIPIGGYSEINTTRVLPQARVSGRVPFGTGASMMKWMEGTGDEFLTYNMDSFQPLKELFSGIASVHKLKNIPDEMLTDETFREFLRQNEFNRALEEFFNNSSSLSAFTKRFFNWFDAFRIVKYLNFSAQRTYPKAPVQIEAGKLASINNSGFSVNTKEEMLEFYRRWDRTRPGSI